MLIRGLCGQIPANVKLLMSSQVDHISHAISQFKMGGIQYVPCVGKDRRGGLLGQGSVPGLTLPSAYVSFASLVRKLVK